jgi:hypothetical protein
VWMGPLSSWKTASLFRKIVWIMWCNLITQPIHVLPCSNSVMKCNNGTNRIPYLPCVSLLEPAIPDCRLPWVFSKHKLFLTQGIMWKFSSCSPTLDVRFVKIMSDSFCGNRVFKMNIQFWCHLCCSSSVIFQNNPYQYMTVSVIVVFLWFMYADVSLETLALDTSYNVVVFVTDAPAKRASAICPLSKSDKSPIFRFFTHAVTQHNH